MREQEKRWLIERILDDAWDRMLSETELEETQAQDVVDALRKTLERVLSNKDDQQ